ncbi:TerD family protein [Geodermatophilus sp. CPCC 206100]
MPELTRGQNASLPEDVQRLRVVVTWDQQAEDVDVDASALLLDERHRVRSDEDFVFYNQPAAADGSVQYLGGASTDTGMQESLALDLEHLPADCCAVAVTASVSSGTFGDLSGLRMLVLDSTGQQLASYDIADVGEETAFVFGEVYRRDGGWRVRAVGQGWDSGLAGLAQSFGVTVDSDDAGDELGDLSSEEPEADCSATGGTDEPLAPEVDEADESAPGDDDLVDVLEVEAASEAEPMAVVIELPQPRATPVPRADAAGSRPAREARKGVRTRKQPQPKPAKPALRLAGDESWQAARLFSISGVGNAEEQEKRATSALLATMMGVRPFGRGVTARVGAPAGTVETYLEVAFPRGEQTVFPDGVIRVARGSRLWTGLLETKTGNNPLRRDQVENYLDVARQQGFDAVITLSNDIPPAVGEHPVAVDRRKLAKVALFHLSWAEVLHEARMVLTHRGVEDPDQAWILSEFIRYLEHPRSGAVGFDDMGPSWVPVREAVAAGTLRAGDRKVPEVVDAWTRLIRHLTMRLTAELGVAVTHVLPRKLASDPDARSRAGVESLASTGSLSATLKVPGAAGPVTVVADLRTTQVRVSAKVSAPQEGTSQRRISWLLRQLKDAPDDLLIDVLFQGGRESTCEQLRDVREKPAALTGSTGSEVTSFVLTWQQPLGLKRSGVRGAFIPSITQALEGFYARVVQPVRPWVAPAPQLPEDAVVPGDQVEADSREDVAG